MNKYKNVLFDLDGTLLDTTDGVLMALDATIKDFGYESLKREDALSFIGPPLKDSFMGVIHCDDEKAEQMITVFRKYYTGGMLYKSKVYDGIFDALKEFKNKGIGIGVATYKLEDSATDLLKQKGVTDYLDVLRGADAKGKLTKADIIDICIKELGGRPEDTVLIGDSEYDAIGAKNSGIDFIAVTYGFGFHSSEDASEYTPIAICDNAHDVINAVLSN